MVLVTNGSYEGGSAHKSMIIFPVGKSMISWVTAADQYNRLWYSILCDIIGIMRIRGHPRYGWMLKYYDIIVMYDMVWSRKIHSIEVYHIRTGSVVGLWKILCSIWNSKDYCSGCRWIFFWGVKKYFQETMIIPLQ